MKTKEDGLQKSKRVWLQTLENFAEGMKTLDEEVKEISGGTHSHDVPYSYYQGMRKITSQMPNTSWGLT